MPFSTLALYMSSVWLFLSYFIISHLVGKMILWVP